MTRNFLAAIMTAVALIGCTTQTRRVGPDEIKFDVPASEKIGIHEIHRNGRRIGTLETYRIIDGDNIDSNDREQMFVRDEHGGTIGFITDEFQAYRFRAHEHADLVASHGDLGTNVLAVFGWNDGQIMLKRVSGN